MNYLEQVVSDMKQQDAEMEERRRKIYTPQDNEDMGVDFGTQWDLSRHSDNDDKQRQLIAEEFGVPVSDVFQTKDGFAYRKGDKSFLASPSDFGSQAQQLGADLLSKPGAMIGGAIGAVGGVPGMMAGTAVGDLAQTAIEEYGEGNERSAGEYAQSAALETAFAGAGELAYRGGKALKNKWTKPKPINGLAEADKLMKMAKKHGINLTPAEATGDRVALNAQNWLMDTPTRGARKLDDFMSGRQTDVSNAIDAALGSKSPHEAYNAYRKQLAGKRSGLVKERAVASDSHYRKAADIKVKDLQPVVDHLAQRIDAIQGTKIGGALKRVHRGITRIDGDEVVPKELIKDLHYSKLDIDDMMEAAYRKGNGNEARELAEVKEQLLEVMEQVSDDYRLGRETYKDYSQPINDFDDGVQGALIKEGKKPTPNLGRIVFGSRSSPEMVRQLRQTVPDTAGFEDMVVGHLRSEFNKLSQTVTGDIGNIGGIYAKTVFGSEHKRALLREALPADKYQALSDLMEVLQATSKGFKGNSITAQRQVMNERATGELGLGSLNKRYSEYSFDKTADNMAGLLTNEHSQKSLSDAIIDIRKYARASGGEAEKKYNVALRSAISIIGGEGLSEALED